MISMTGSHRVCAVNPGQATSAQSKLDKDDWEGGRGCYVLPNIGANGGVKETNLYILAGPLHYERSEEVDLTRFKD
jgi:hypothetical protein